MLIPRPRPDIAFSPHVNSAESGRGGVGGGLGSKLQRFLNLRCWSMGGET